MTVTELRKELEQLETDGQGDRPIVLQVNNNDGDCDFSEATTLRPLKAEGYRCSDFKPGQMLVVIE